MKVYTIILSLLSVGVLSNCASQNKKMNSSTAPVTGSGQTAVAGTKPLSRIELEQKRRMLEESKQDQKDQDLMLQKKRNSADNNLNPQAKDKKLEVKPENIDRLSEGPLYREMVQKFERNDEFGFQQRFQRLMAKYPKSPLADDALYLSGLQQVGLKNYGAALKNFSDVIQNYPYGNRRVSALFAKGAVYKKMNFENLAKDVFQQVIAKFPGSPEALRAGHELKMISIK